MDYFECKLKILELKKQIFNLKEERRCKNNEIIEKNKFIKNQGNAILNKLKNFYLDGYRNGYRNIYDFNLNLNLLYECYGADAISGSTEYMERYNDARKFDFHTSYCYMIDLYIDIVKKFGTCNMNIFDKNFDEFVFKKTPNNERIVICAVKNVLDYSYDYKNISKWFRKNADRLENIKLEWQLFNYDDYKFEEDFYDNQIKELEDIIFELNEYSKQLKEQL